MDLIGLLHKGGLGNAQAKLFCEDEQSAFVGDGRDYHELFPAKTRDQVGATDCCEQATGEFLQDEIPTLVAVFIVDPFEVIDVDHEETERLPRAMGARDFAQERFVEQSAVCKMRERIMSCCGGKVFIRLTQTLQFVCFCFQQALRRKQAKNA